MCNMIVIIGFYFNTHLDSDYLEFLSEIVEAIIWEGTYDQFKSVIISSWINCFVTGGRFQRVIKVPILFRTIRLFTERMVEEDEDTFGVEAVRKEGSCQR